MLWLLKKTLMGYHVRSTKEEKEGDQEGQQQREGKEGRKERNDVYLTW